MHLRVPKSSPKRAASKNPLGWRRYGIVFRGEVLKILALSPENRRNLLFKKHFLRPAFYSAVSPDALKICRYPPRRPSALAEVACVGNRNTSHTFCIRLSAAVSWHSRNPITQLFRFIRPAT